jgi:beta-xylosidase
MSTELVANHRLARSHSRSRTVVSDYGAVTFLQLMHRIAGTGGEAAALALAAGIDVELPSTLCYGQPLLDEI